ncbi:neurogenic locus notch homolog protein 2-like [Gigantopelta aegis]|uniref:neurogenic locus notch homolog protein 2-like n=1 Tax=Gigantopelta aegis TaxID=1735272 RepID=UPI001B88C1FF|nr:neurogenic locus notch homolog protein 2-like [Gigantopelta aegis]
MAGNALYYFILVGFFILQTKHIFAAFENVAVGKTAYQSSYLAGVPAGNAVDGNISQSDARYSILTNVNQPYTWWEVDLSQEYFIHQVVIYFRADFTWRRNGIQVYTSSSVRQGNGGTSCGLQITGRDDGSDIDDITTRTCDVTGRYVTIYQDYNNPQGSTVMDFCEVVVKACPLNKYGSDCDKLCADRKCARSGSPCSIWTGTCDGGCQDGWKNKDCTIDLDECAENNPCAVKAKCSNTRGSYTCTCLNGFTGTRLTCQDVNECQTGTFPCDTNADCKNTVGSYTCGCRDGYSGNGKTCNDINECETGTYPCGTNAVCGNTVGSYTCTCKVGFTGDRHTCTACESDVKYGSNCIRSCSDRKCATTSSTCDAKTGACDGACKQGW